MTGDVVAGTAEVVVVVVAAEVVVVVDVVAAGSDVSGEEVVAAGTAEVVVVVVSDAGADVDSVSASATESDGDDERGGEFVLGNAGTTVSVMIGWETTEALSPSLLLSLSPDEQPAARISAVQITAIMPFFGTNLSLNFIFLHLFGK